MPSYRVTLTGMDHPLNNEPRLLTPAQFGRKIGRSRATIYRLINNGLIPVVHLPVAAPGLDEDGNKKRGQGAVRISSETLDAFARGELKAVS